MKLAARSESIKNMKEVRGKEGPVPVVDLTTTSLKHHFPFKKNEKEKEETYSPLKSTGVEDDPYMVTISEGWLSLGSSSQGSAPEPPAHFVDHGNGMASFLREDDNEDFLGNGGATILPERSGDLSDPGVSESRNTMLIQGL